MKEFRDFEDTKKFVVSLNLKGHKEWKEYCKSGEKPDDIPTTPERVYKDKGWKGIRDFLGTEIKLKDFESAREFARSLNLKGQNEWFEYCKSGNKPDDIQYNVQTVYKNKGWTSWGDWLGTGTVAPKDRIYRPFPEAREFVRKLNLKSGTEWKEYCKSGKKPDDIPASLPGLYKNKGWKGIGDFLGTNIVSTKDKQFRDFESAKKFAMSLNLKNQKEWQAYAKSGKKPDDIPASLPGLYKNKGWTSWMDWLRNGEKISRNRKFSPFKEAREFVQSLGLKGQNEWFEYCKSGNKPDDIPAAPNQVYKDKGWKGMGDFLGTGTVAPKDRIHRPFPEAREFVRKLNLKSGTEWKEYCKSGNKPDDIPNTPDGTYRYKGWTSWIDWLGTEFCSFTEAREFVRNLNLKGTKEWYEYCKSGNKPDNIPISAHNVYKKDFKGYGDFFGTGNVAPKDRVFRSFEESREFVQKLSVKTIRKWQEYCKSGNKPDDIPVDPAKVYKKEWKGWDEFMGTGIFRYSGQYRSFKEARQFVRKLNLKRQNEWYEYCKSGKKPDDIPASLPGLYKNKGWTSWGNWLGTGRVADKNKVFHSFEEARNYVRNLGLKNTKEWNEYCKSGNKPDNIPSSPPSLYKNKFKGYGDWLGTGVIADRDREFLSFKEAREFVRKLEVKGDQDWRRYCKSGNKPDDIPANPNIVYKNNGYVNLGDFLGTGTIQTQQRVYRPFKEAREFVRSLNLKGTKEWQEYCKSGEKPDDIPSAPWETYKEWKKK